ncbi:hypothetical protein, partial [Phocaeicola coprophilus]|uniref:hypothetical protein n=1 Tax=Phocaeicola coprophilus TaxID=387090 RepID=UPI0026DC64FC
MLEDISDQQKMVRNKIAEQIQFRPSSQKSFGEEGLNNIRSDAKESKFPILGCHLLDGCLLAP